MFFRVQQIDLATMKYLLKVYDGGSKVLFATEDAIDGAKVSCVCLQPYV